MKRKVFLQQLGATALLGYLGISMESCTYEQLEDMPTPTGNPNSDDDNPSIPDNAFSIDLNQDPFSVLLINDGWLLYKDQQYLLVNVAGVISAFSSVCPHTGCADDWEVENQQFVCTCHFSRFNLDGSLAGGPADTDLQKLTAIREGDTLYIA